MENTEMMKVSVHDESGTLVFQYDVNVATEINSSRKMTQAPPIMKQGQKILNALSISHNRMFLAEIQCMAYHVHRNDIINQDAEG